MGLHPVRCFPPVPAGGCAGQWADCVLVCLTLKTGSEATDARNVEIFAELCLKSHKLGLPVIGEYFPHSHLTKEPGEFHEEILMGCRMLTELGADCIKTFHTQNFREVTSTCAIPILGLGAEKTPTDLDALKLAEKEIRDGARAWCLDEMPSRPPILRVHRRTPGDRQAGMSASAAAKKFKLSH